MPHSLHIDTAKKPESEEYYAEKNYNRCWYFDMYAGNITFFLYASGDDDRLPCNGRVIITGNPLRCRLS